MATEDRYANIASATVTESGTGTLTFQEILTNVGPVVKVGMLLDEINYHIPAAEITKLVGDGDEIRMGWTVSNQVTDLEDFTDRRILHTASLIRKESGTPGNFAFHRNPMQYQFFPPLIHAERRIYLAVLGVSLASAVTVRSRIYYRTVDLTPQNFLELSQTFQLIG